MSEPQLGVNFAAIKVVDGEPLVLLQQRDENSPKYKLFWTIPGGGFDEDEGDENLLDTASRELEEEYGIQVEANKFKKVTDRQDHNPGAVYAVYVDEDTPVDMKEGKNYQWFPVNKLSTIMSKFDLGYEQNEFILALQEFVMTENHLEVKNEFKIS